MAIDDLKYNIEVKHSREISIEGTYSLMVYSFFSSLMKLDHHSVLLHFSSYNWITAYVILIGSILSGASRVVTPINLALDAVFKYKVV